MQLQFEFAELSQQFLGLMEETEHMKQEKAEAVKESKLLEQETGSLYL